MASLIDKLKRNLLIVGTFGLAAACSDITKPVVKKPACDSACQENRRLASLEGDLLPLDSLVTIRLETYDGSGQAVHPDGLVFPSLLNGWRYGMVVTPYPNSEGRDRFENPSFYVSNNFRYWTTVTDTTRNPIARPSENTHLSDNSILFDTQINGLRVNYRETFPNVEDRVYTKTSTNGGISWSESRLMLRGQEFEFISPTLVDRRMWYIDAHEGCNSTTTTLKERISQNGEDFSEATLDSLVQPNYVPWHINIDYIESLQKYVGLLAAYPANSAYSSGCLLTDLFLITSEDGRHWTTYQNPLMRNTYESAIMNYENNNNITIMYSIIERPFGEYSLAVGRHNWQDLLSRVGSPNP